MKLQNFNTNLIFTNVMSMYLLILLLGKWFEPRSIPWLKKIIWVILVLRRTVVNDWHYDNLCWSHLQSQVQSLSSESRVHLTLKMASAQVVKVSVTNNCPSQDSNHPDYLSQSRFYHYSLFNSELWLLSCRHSSQESES